MRSLRLKTPSELNARQATTSKFVQRGCQTLLLQKRIRDEMNPLLMLSFIWCTVQCARPERLNNKTAACGEPEMKKESQRDFQRGGSQLTAATCIDRRTIILDWSSRKLLRLCKCSWAAQAQYTARAFHMLESVKMYVASRKSATLDLQMEKTMTRHGVFPDAHRSRAVRWEIKKQRTAIQLKIANERFQQAACDRCWTNILQELAGGLTMTSPRQCLPTSFGPTQPRTMPDNNDKKLLDWCSERRHSECRCLGLQAT